MALQEAESRIDAAAVWLEVPHDVVRSLRGYFLGIIGKNSVRDTTVGRTWESLGHNE